MTPLAAASVELGKIADELARRLAVAQADADLLALTAPNADPRDIKRACQDARQALALLPRIARLQVALSHVRLAENALADLTPEDRQAP